MQDEGELQSARAVPLSYGATSVRSDHLVPSKVITPLQLSAARQKVAETHFNEVTMPPSMPGSRPSGARLQVPSASSQVLSPSVAAHWFVAQHDTCGGMFPHGAIGADVMVLPAKANAEPASSAAMQKFCDTQDTPVTFTPDSKRLTGAAAD